MTSHVVELPILTEPWEESKIDKRLEAGKEAYNAVLGEYLKRAKLAQDSLEMKKAEQPSDVYQSYGVRFRGKDAGDTRREVIEKGCWIHDHLAANTLDSIAARALRSVEEWLYGPKGKPNFRTATRRNPFDSIASSNGFSLQEDVLEWSTSRGGLDELYLDLEIDDRAKMSLQDTADQPRICVKRKRIHKEWRYFCDVTCNGYPPYTAEPTPNDAPIGVVVRPVMVTIVGPDQVWRLEMASEIQEDWDTIQRLDRKISRQKRANNPDKVAQDGSWLPREEWESAWDTSKRQDRTQAKRQELYRTYAEHRKRCHEKLANWILSWGTTITLVDRPYKILQQLGRGKEIRDCAPGRFVEILSYKAVSVGGELQRTSEMEESPFEDAEGHGSSRDLEAGRMAQQLSVDRF